MKNKIKRNIKEGILSEESDIKDIWRRIKTRDFSGNTGIAVKNSVYNFSKTLISKIGSLIFVIILARLLMPELFGLYSLALSTILVFAAFSQLGINQALVRFTSNALGKNKKNKAKSYIKYFGKIQFFLFFLSVILILIFSKFIAETYYQKPIFLALLAGVLYILFIRVSSFFVSILNSLNDFKNDMFQEVAHQSSRIILVPLAVVYALKYSLSSEMILFYIILLLAISYLIAGVVALFVVKNKPLFKIKTKEKQKQKSLSEKERKEANKFVLLTAVIAISGTFFGNIDKIMLGGFVAGEFIGYYQAAFSLIGALTSLSAFGAVLLPIFSRMKKVSLNRAMKKTIRIVLLISTGIFTATLIFSHLAILIIYGREYLLATNVLRLLTVLIFILPITSIYITYFMSENKPEIVAKSLVFSTFLNVILNYILITTMLQFGEISAVYGAAIATITSKFVYLGMLVWRRQ